MEIEKMSDEEFISEINASGLYFEAKNELRKRLSKNNIEEFKKKLIEEINKLASSEKGFIHKQETINLINNIGNKKLNWDGWKDPKQEAEKAVLIYKNNIK